MVSPCSATDEAAGKCFGGYGRITTMVHKLRLQAAKKGAAYYFLHAGDEFTGSTYDVVAPGEAEALLQRAPTWRPDVQTLGARAAASFFDARLCALL